MAEMWFKMLFFSISGILTDLAVTDVNNFHSLVISTYMFFQLRITYGTLRYFLYISKDEGNFCRFHIYALPIPFHISSWMDIGTLTNPKCYFCCNCNFPVKSHVMGGIYVTNEIK